MTAIESSAFPLAHLICCCRRTSPVPGSQAFLLHSRDPSYDLDPPF